MKPIILDFDTAIRVGNFLEDILRESEDWSLNKDRSFMCTNRITYTNYTKNAALSYLAKFGSVFQDTINKYALPTA